MMNKQKEIIYNFQISKNIVFEVSYRTLKGNSTPYFSTSAWRFNRSKTDFSQGGQAQAKLLPTNSPAWAFWAKWDKYHLHELSNNTHAELLVDVEQLKEQYNYIESDTFCEQRKLSFEKVKKSNVSADVDPFKYVHLTHCGKIKDDINGTWWGCFLENEKNHNKVMIKFFLSFGYNGRKPYVYEIIGAAIQDAHTVDYCATVKIFMDEFGYTDQKQAADIMEQCAKNTKKIEALGIDWRKFND